MDQIKDILNTFKGYSLSQLSDIVYNECREVYPRMQRLFGLQQASDILMHLILCTMAVDGFMATYEFAVVRKTLEALQNRSLTENDCVRLINDCKSGYSRNLNTCVTAMRDIRRADPDAFVNLCTMISAIIVANGTVDKLEESWFREFFN